MRTTPKRRNSKPSEVRVKSIADFEKQGLNEKVDSIVENRNEIVIHNLEYLLKRENISQATMCQEILENSPLPSQISLFKKAGVDIPFRTVARIAAAYNYTPEKLYGQLLDQSDGLSHTSKKLSLRPEDEYRKYIGTYHLAYFKTDRKPGNNNRTTARSLSYGLLTVYPGNVIDGIPQLRVSAYTSFTDQVERDTLLRYIRSAEASGNSRNIKACYEKIVSEQSHRMKYLYEGDLTLTEEISEITMNQAKGHDVIHIHFLNRAAHSSDGSMYKGGLGAMLSTSRGAEHQPCLQSAILSKRGFDHLAKEAVAEALRIGPVDFDLQDGVRSIVTYAKALFQGNDAETPLSALADKDKEYMLASYIEKIVTEAIRSNVLSYFKISTEMDSLVYKTFC